MSYDAKAKTWYCEICKKPISYEIDKSFDACKEHQPEYYVREKNKRKEKHRRHLDTYGEIEETNKLFCPYCLERIEDWWEYGFREDEDREVTCDHCEKEFNVNLRIEYVLTTKIKEDKNDR